MQLFDFVQIKTLFAQDKKVLHRSLFWLISTIICTFALSTTIILQIYILSTWIASVLGNARIDLLNLVIQFSLIFAARIGLKLIIENQTQKFASCFKYAIRSQIISLYMPKYEKKIQVSQVMHLLKDGVEEVELFINIVGPQFLCALIVPTSLIISLFIIDYISALIVVTIIPLLPLFMTLIGKMSKTEAKKQWVNLQKTADYFFELLLGIQTIVLNDALQYFLSRLQAKNIKYKASLLKTLRVAFLSALILEFAATIAIAILAVEVAIRVLTNELSIYRAFMVVLIAPEIFGPIRQLSQAVHVALQGKNAFKKILAVLNKIENIDLPKIDLRTWNIIECQENAFSIKRYDKIAITGKSGSGKTTLLKSILGISNRKKITLDGNTINVQSMRDLCSWMPQNPNIVNGSISDNILLANPTLNIKDLFTLMDMLGIENYFCYLPNNLNTIVNDDGSNLSNGQKQILFILRTLIKPADIYLFDEPIVALDQTNLLIFEKVLAYLKAHTVLIVTHNRYIESLCDKSYNLDDQ